LLGAAPLFSQTPPAPAALKESAMLRVKSLTSSFAVAPQIEVDDVHAVRREGFQTVINNRPDGESPEQPPSAHVMAAAEAVGLAYHFIPVAPWEITDDNVAALENVLRRTEGPILAFCRSGTRCACLWALAEAPRLGAEDVLRAAATAGYDLSALELGARIAERSHR
jgi:sulfide:quinone oxidoreductase